jgi:hypothetical protein
MLGDLFLIATAGLYLGTYRDRGERRDLLIGGSCLFVGLLCLWRDMVKL